MGKSLRLVAGLIVVAALAGFYLFSDRAETEDATAVTSVAETTAVVTETAPEVAAEPDPAPEVDSVTETAAVTAEAEEPETATLLPSSNPILVIQVGGSTSGTIEIELLPDLAPQHVGRIVELAESGTYDNVVFHRVIDGFMAQTGDVEFGTRDNSRASFVGSGASDMPDLKAEFSSESFVAGIVGMARSASPDSANSQFFIMFDVAPFLDGQYTVVGKVIAGQAVVDAIKKGDQAQNGSVQDPDYMAKVSVR